MKRILGGLFIITMVSFVAWQVPVGAAEHGKIGVVDLQRCIQETTEGKKIYQELKAKKDAMQKQLDDRQNELMKMKEDLEKQSMMLSVDAKEDKQKEFERKGREFKYIYDDLSEDMKKAEAEAKKNILQDLEKVVSKIGERDKYEMIFERRTSGIMFLDNAIDITDSVIKAYDAGRK